MSLHVTNMIFNTVLIFCQLNTMAAALPSRFSRKATFLFFNAVGLALLGCCGVLAALFDPDTAISIFGTAYWFPQIAAGLFVAQRRDGQFWCIFFSPLTPQTLACFPCAAWASSWGPSLRCAS